MNNVKEGFKSKKVIVTIIFGIICVGILFFAYRKRVESKVNSISVPYANVEINSREEITSEMVSTVKVAKAMLSDNVIRNVSDVVGKYVNYNTVIPKGSLFYGTSVVEWSDMPDSAWSDIKDGNTVVSLSVSGLVMFSNSIYPGANIDLYYQTYSGNKLVYGKLIENIKVLAVKDHNGNHIFEKTANQNGASAIIFSVPEDLHLLLRKASYLSGKIVPVLRNAKYTDDSEESKTLVSSDFIKELILEQTIDVPLDEVSNVNENITVNNNKN